MKMLNKKWLARIAVSMSFLFATSVVASGAAIQDAEKDSPKATKPQEKKAEKKESSDKKSDKKEDAKAKSSEEKKDAEKKTETKSKRRKRVARYEKFQKSNQAMLGLLGDQVKAAAKATVGVVCGEDDDPVALGTVIDKRGFVMTKASRLKGLVRCKLPNGKTVPAIVCGIDQVTDLALLRVQAYNLSSIDLSKTTKSTKEGHWLLSPSNDGKLLGYGVLSVAARKIPPVPGFIGITMQPSEGGVVVASVVPKSAADKFGLKTGDLIVMIETNKVKVPADMSKVLKTKRPGDVVALKVLRGKDKKDKKEDLSLRIVLGNRMEDTPQAQRSMMQNTMSGPISKRRDDFPVAIQHDTYLRPEQCGGPITDLDGNVIGLNISRSGRVKSYALPLTLVQSVYKKLATGEFSPDVVYRDKVDNFNKILKTLSSKKADLSKKMDGLSADQKKAEKVVEGQQADVDLVQSEIKSLKEKMAELEKKLKEKKEVLSKGKLKRIQIGSNIKKSKRMIGSVDKQKAEIEKKLQGLLFGAE